VGALEREAVIERGNSDEGRVRVQYNEER